MYVHKLLDKSRGKFRVPNKKKMYEQRIIFT